MAEEYTCIECENLYDDMDGDTDERMCNNCIIQYQEDQDFVKRVDGVIDVNENGNLVKGERRSPDIHRSSTVHYPDWNMKKKEYIVPPNKRKERGVTNE